MRTRLRSQSEFWLLEREVGWWPSLFLCAITLISVVVGVSCAVFRSLFDDFYRSGTPNEEMDGAMKLNIHKMNTSVRLNRVIRENSPDSQLILLNLPSPPRNRLAFNNSYMVRDSSSESSALYCFQTYLDVLTEDLPRVLFIGGSGREVITIDSWSNHFSLFLVSIVIGITYLDMHPCHQYPLMTMLSDIIMTLHKLGTIVPSVSSLLFGAHTFRILDVSVNFSENSTYQDQHLSYGQYVSWEFHKTTWNNRTSPTILSSIFDSAVWEQRLVAR